MSFLSQHTKLKSYLIRAALLGIALSPPAIAQAQTAESLTSTISGKVSILDSEGNRIADRSNVVIFIDGMANTDSDARESNPHLMSHQNRLFTPEVLPILKGERLDFYNDDDIFHNVFSLSTANKFDLGIYPSGTSKLVAFPTPGLVKIYCNIHPDMVSTILVLNNGFFAKTDAEGNFEIKNVPDGILTLRVWHEFSDEFQRSITVESSGQLDIPIELIETKKRISHRNKFGMPYREKY